ncbi:MAG: SDR family oxidoreductase [bacterium]|nr:SDR family oxidoreductase [bacterium]
MKIQDKVVVITGSSKGLGKSLACAFAGKGAKVVVNARNKDELMEVVNVIDAFPVVANVTKEKEVLALTDAVIDKYSRIDIWINNAGIWMPHVSIEEMDWKRVHELMEVNLFGTIYGSKAALIQMRKQGSGVIVNIISTSGLQGRPDSSGYCASKYAARGFTESLRAETVNSNIKVIAAYPGGMKTHLFDEQKPSDIDSYMEPEFVADKIIQNLMQDNPEEELIVRRPIN